MVKTEIKSSSSWFDINFKEWWKYNNLMYTFAWRDIKVRYSQTFLGLFWSIFQPLVSLCVLYIVFGKIAGFADNNPKYPIMLLCGIVLWQYFNNVFTQSSLALINAQDMISKIYFPKIFLTFSKGLTFLVDLAISLLILVLALVFYSEITFLGLLVGLIYIILFVIFSVSIGGLASSLIVRFRDLRFIYQFLLQFLLYASPIAYQLSNVPEKYKIIFLINPITWYVEGFRNAILNKPPLDFGLILCTIISAFTFCMTLVVFNKVEKTIADVI